MVLNDNPGVNTLTVHVVYIVCQRNACTKKTIYWGYLKILSKLLRSVGILREFPNIRSSVNSLAFLLSYFIKLSYDYNNVYAPVL